MRSIHRAAAQSINQSINRPQCVRLLCRAAVAPWVRVRALPSSAATAATAAVIMVVILGTREKFNLIRF